MATYKADYFLQITASVDLIGYHYQYGRTYADTEAGAAGTRCSSCDEYSWPVDRRIDASATNRSNK